jgi:hypothetical protein
LHGFDETDVLGEHDEFQNVAADAAPKAAPGAGARKDNQVGSSAISVKRAPADDGTALTFELDTVARDNVLACVCLSAAVSIRADWSGRRKLAIATMAMPRS